MANPFQQMAQQRKLIYTVLILALFTGSLVHRKLVIEPDAFKLQLRETARGEVELTGSAVRLSLTGSRGLAVTVLWSAALEKMKKHEWNDVEMLVGSITKLQPYFITPWVFQSWNLSFNVAVECDRPVDKYYYIARGLELLAEGERRNQGVADTSAAGDIPQFPGNPDMRHHMGMTYQLKIGSSDEKNVMRCLLEMSCIDPAKRDPELFWKFSERSKQVDTKELLNFCVNHPRLVRRLREKIGYEDEKQLIKFLADASHIPSRFEERTSREQTQTPLKRVYEQFPVLPRHEADWPNPESYELTQEGVDVYVIGRTWFQYAQKPLPDPVQDIRELRLNVLKNRLPKAMALQIFRGYPARSQAFIAETLEEDGWFDEEGWTIRDWFDDDPLTQQGETVVGRESKYHAGPAWNKAYEMYLDYGTQNGLYIAEKDRQHLEEQAAAFRKKHQLNPGDRTPPLRSDQQDEGYKAHDRLFWNEHYRRMCNFDSHLLEAEAERVQEAVTARKLFFHAEKARRVAIKKAEALYAQAIPLWRDALLQRPQYAETSSSQEATYEMERKYFLHVQREHREAFKAVTMGAWQVLQWPYIPWSQILSPNDKNQILPIRTARGPFSMTQYYNGPGAAALKEPLLLWTLGAGFPPRLPHPLLKNMLLTQAPLGAQSLGPQWRFLVTEDTARMVRDRMGVSTPTPAKK